MHYLMHHVMPSNALSNAQVSALALDVEALHGVMSHDVQYKVTRHATHPHLFSLTRTPTLTPTPNSDHDPNLDP